MNTSSKKPSTRSLPNGWRAAAGRIVPPSSSARAEDPPPQEPEKEAPPAAEDPMQCAECGGEVPASEPPAKFCPHCGAELPAPEEGTGDAPAGAAAFAGFALSITGAKGLEAARGTIKAWKEGSSRADALAKELGEKSARLATIERERLLEQAVADGRLDPAQAWSFSVDAKGSKVRSFSEWAGPFNAATGKGQSLEQLAAYLDAQRPGTASPARSKTLTPTTAAKPSAAPPVGMNPDLYAAASRIVAEQLGEK